jgi:hypothetical protein
MPSLEVNRGNGLFATAPIELIDRVVAVNRPARRRRYGTAIARLANGDLLLSYHESAGEANLNDGAAMIARSRDGGKTWDDPIALYAEPGWNCLALDGMKVLPDGTVLMVLGKMQRSFNPDTTYGLGMYKSQTSITRSTDHGYTWSELEPLEQFWPYFEEMYGPGDPFVLSENKLLFCIQGTREIGGKGWEAGVTTTDATARAFSKPVIIASDPEIDFNDTALMRTADGRILAVMRTEQAPFDAYQSHSSDDGATWSPARKTGFLGGTPSLYKLRNGDIACFYREREPSRPGVSISVTRDSGESWEWIGQVYESPDWFCGYPGTARLDDETFVCAYFTAIEDSHSEVHVAFLRDRS